MVKKKKSFARIFTRNRRKIKHHSSELKLSTISINKDDQLYLKNENVSNGKTKEDNLKIKKSNQTLRPGEKNMNSEILRAGVIGSVLGSSEGKTFFSSMLDDNTAVDDHIYNNYDFPFTNLVFEGGGNKGMAYAGALQVFIYTQ